MAIAMSEILKGAKLEDQTPEIQANLLILLDKMNKLRSIYDKPMSINSGLRTHDDQIRVYKELAASRGQKFDESKIPWGSAHLKGAAVDIADNSSYDLMAWCKANVKVLEDIGIWCEEQDDQHRVHFQIYAPHSGNRFFKP